MSYTQHEQERARLADMLHSLAQLAVAALRGSLLTLRRMDPIGARELIRDDEHIDVLQRDIDALVHRTVALRQPVARDLRRIVATAAVASELERVGDYAKTIAKAVLRLTSQPERMPHPPELMALGELALHMLEDAMAAFVAQDVAGARAVAHTDEEADRLEAGIAQTVREAAAADLRRLEAGLALLQIASVLERLADRATNIAERAVFFATGATEELN